MMHDESKSQFSQKKLSRRRYIKYAAAGIVVGAAAVAGLGYYASRSSPPGVQPTHTQTASMSEKERELSLREEYSKLYPPQKLRVRIKGVCYCVGTGEATGGHAYRLSDEDMKKDVGDIHGTLGCNGIKIYGDNQERIVKCATMAIEKGFDRILLLPWYIEATHDELVSCN